MALNSRPGSRVDELVDELIGSRLVEEHADAVRRPHDVVAVGARPPGRRRGTSGCPRPAESRCARGPARRACARRRRPSRRTARPLPSRSLIQTCEPGSMPSAAAEPSLTSSSSEASRSGQPAGHDDRIARPRRRRRALVDLDHRRRPGPARRRCVATSIIVHDALPACADTRPSIGSVAISDRRHIGVARREIVRRVRLDPGRAEVDQHVRRIGDARRTGRAGRRAATGCPRRHRHGGGEAGEQRQRRRWRPGAGARARPSASVPPRCTMGAIVASQRAETATVVPA